MSETDHNTDDVQKFDLEDAVELELEHIEELVYYGDRNELRVRKEFDDRKRGGNFGVVYGDYPKEFEPKNINPDDIPIFGVKSVTFGNHGETAGEVLGNAKTTRTSGSCVEVKFKSQSKRLYPAVLFEKRTNENGDAYLEAIVTYCEKIR